MNALKARCARHGGWLALFLVGITLGIQVKVQAQDEANLPRQVRDSIKEQLRAFKIPDYLKGMPWLDKSTNWNDFNNWPDQVQHLGTTYALKLTGQDYDAFFDIKSRLEVKPGKDFSARLIPQDFPTTNHILASVSCYWSKGRKTESALEGVSGGYIRTVFILRFYPTGELHAFSRHVLGSRTYREDYFDKGGELTGYLVYPERGTGTNTYIWKGTAVSVKEFLKRSKELYTAGTSAD